MSDDDLFDRREVRVEVKPEDLPGYKGPRVACSQCGESIQFKREVERNGSTLCRSCAGESYFHTLP